MITTLVGLEYTTYRYLKVKPEYDPHWRDREVLEPAEVTFYFPDSLKLDSVQFVAQTSLCNGLKMKKANLCVLNAQKGL